MTSYNNINYKLLVVGFIFYITVITFSGLTQSILHSGLIIYGLSLMLSFWLSLIIPFILTVFITYIYSRKIWNSFVEDPLTINKIIRNLFIILIILLVSNFVYPILIKDTLVSSLPTSGMLGFLYTQKQQLVIDIFEPLVTFIELITLIFVVSSRK